MAGWAPSTLQPSLPGPRSSCKLILLYDWQYTTAAVVSRNRVKTKEIAASFGNCCYLLSRLLLIDTLQCTAVLLKHCLPTCNASTASGMWALIAMTVSVNHLWNMWMVLAIDHRCIWQSASADILYMFYSLFFTFIVFSRRIISTDGKKNLMYSTAFSTTSLNAVVRLQASFLV